MLTLKEHTDGKFYHAEYLYSEELQDYETEAIFLTDDDGELFPASICLCSAYEPGECCCATTSWERYDYELDY